jgi:hypothetical protein
MNAENFNSYHHALKHIKQAFDPEILTSAKKRILDGIRQCDVSSLSEREQIAVSRGEAPDSLRLDSKNYDIWSNASNEVIKSLGDFLWIYYPPQFRNIEKEVQEVRWHQDAGFNKALGNKAHKQIMTCFIPLDEKPSERVTVQFSREIYSFLEHAPTSNGFAAGLKRDFMDLIHYDLELGDAVLFGDFVPHRTFAPEDTIWQRSSFEFRLIRKADALGQKDYFDLLEKKFVQLEAPSPLNH